MPRSPLLPLLAAAAVLTSAPSMAQEEADVRAAARAFEEGQRAQLAGEYARAAGLFEIAHRAAPAAAALRAAIRNHRAAGTSARAATLSLEAITRYASDAPTRALAQEVLTANEGSLGRIRVVCATACGLTVDGGVVSLRSTTEMEIFVDPGSRTVTASFDAGGEATATVEVAAGAARAVRLEAPVEPPGETTIETTETETTETTEPAETTETPVPGTYRREPRRLERESRQGWPPAVTYVGLGVTAAFGSALVWSIVNLFDTNKSYEANPTRELYESGQDKIRRTWILGVTTGVLAIGTLLIAVLATDWYGDDDEDAGAWVPSLSLSPQSIALGLSTRFGGGR